MADRKRKRAANSDVLVSLSDLADAMIPVRQILQADRAGDSSAGAPSTEAMRMRVCRHAAETDNIDTPYGKLIQSFDLTGNGKTHSVRFISPFALLHHLSVVIPGFGEFLYRCVGAAVGSVVLYSDSTTPGNVLRPDQGRSFEAIYYTITAFPGWFRTRSCLGWLPLAYIELSRLEELGVTFSSLHRLLFRKLWDPVPDTWNLLRTGVGLMVHGAWRHFKFKFEGFLGDERGIKYFLSVTGAKGTKPCCKCRNCAFKQDRRIRDEWMMDVLHDLDVRRCDLHTPESFYATADEVRAFAQSGANAQQLTRKGQFSGMTYDPNGILWDDEVREDLNAPDSVIWDPQHCLVASGGVALYHLNAFVLSILEKGFTLQELDDFAGQGWIRLGIIVWLFERNLLIHMCIYMHCIYTCVHVYTYRNIYIYVFDAYFDACILIFIYIKNIYICVYLYLYICTCICTCMLIYIYIYICVVIYIYIYMCIYI